MKTEKWNRAFLLANVVVFLLLLAAACSKSNPVTQPVNPGPSPTVAARPFGSSAIPNDHTFSMASGSTQARGWGFSLVPKVYAQTTAAVSMTGNYSGFCGSGIPGPTTSSASTGIYGLGFNSPRALDECDYENSWVSTAQDVLDAADAPPLIIGGGTLSNLVCGAKSVVMSGATDGEIAIWVDHNGTWTETPIKCYLGAATKTGNGYRATDTSDTYSVADGDNLAAVLTETGGNGDGITGLQVYLGKQ